jgi:hypothetical protein
LSLRGGVSGDGGEKRERNQFGEFHFAVPPLIAETYQSAAAFYSCSDQMIIRSEVKKPAWPKSQAGFGISQSVVD